MKNRGKMLVIEITPYLKCSMIEGWATAVRPSGSTIPASAHPTRRSIYGSGPGHDGSKGIQAVLQDVPQYLSDRLRREFIKKTKERNQ